MVNSLVTRTRVIALVSLAFAAACSEAPTQSATQRVAAPRADVVANAASGQLATGERVNLTIPTQFHAQNPCAGGRFGEIVVFTGDQHLVFDQVVTSNGHLSMVLHWNPENVIGIGQYTGFEYRATGVTQDKVVSGAPLPYTETMTNDYNIIGQGQATNMNLHETVHVTVDANGYVSAWVTDYTLSCKQTPTF